MNTSFLSSEKRIKLTISLLNETIKKQEMRLSIAEIKGDDTNWMRSYEMIDFCKWLKDVLNGNYEMEEEGFI